MGVDAKHPKYTSKVQDWVLMQDCHAGQRQVKSKTVEYLPATSGMAEDGVADVNAPGYQSYLAYLKRAVFPDLVDEAVEALLGAMHHKPPVIELPEAMEPLRESATLQNESLEMLLRRINEEQLITGRVGILADMPATPSQTDLAVQASSRTDRDLPYLAFYGGTSIINWDAGRSDGIQVENLNLVVLDETEFERDDEFEWQEEKKYRVLILGEADVNEATGIGVYSVGVFRDDESLTFTENNMTVPSRIGVTLDFIPFTFINACDIVPEPDKPPLLGLANLSMTIYRGEADYRQSLFMTGQDTLVTTGAGLEPGATLRVGAEGRIDLPANATAEYIGVSSEGISEQRTALENDYTRAEGKGGKLLDSTSGQRESGDALKIRVAARTASLNQVAITGAYGLQNALRQVARWMGLDPETVTVTPNLDFAENVFVPSELVALMAARSTGAPISLQTIHTWLKSKDFTELDFEEEIDRIEAESELSLGATEDGSPEEDEEDDDDQQ